MFVFKPHAAKSVAEILIRSTIIIGVILNIYKQQAAASAGSLISSSNQYTC